MNNLELGESTSKYDISLERALNHSFSTVKLMALTEINRNIPKEKSVSDLTKRRSLLISVIKCVGDNDLAVAKKASDILTTLGLSSLGIKALMSSDVIKVIEEIMDIDEVVRLRIYEVNSCIFQVCYYLLYIFFR